MTGPPDDLRTPIVLLVGEGPPALGGIATFVSEVLRLDLGGRFRVELVNTARSGREQRVSPGRFGWVNALRTLRDAWRVWRSSRNADVVHVATALLPTPTLLRTITIALAARFRRVPVVLHVHTGLANTAAHERYVPTRVQRALLRWLPAERILAVSMAGVRGLLPYVTAPIEVVDNAVDVASFDAPARLETGPVRILYAGTIGRGKGLLELLDALVALRAQGVDGWTVRLAGPPNALEHEEADAVAARYRAAGFGSALLGPKTPDELPSLMTDADVFVLPSHSEGQPIAVLEAMASGLAIVASRVGANPDVIRHGVDGLLIDPRDSDGLERALRSLIEDADLRSRLGASARRRAVERFDAERLAEALAEVWTSVTRGRLSDGAHPTAPREGPVGRPTKA